MSDVSIDAIPHSAAEAYLRRLKASGKFGAPNDNACRILELLFRRHETSRGETLSAGEIATELNWPPAQADVRVRQVIKRMRDNLSVYQREHADSLEFELPKLERGYRLDIRPASAIEADVKLLFNNRSHPENYLRKMLLRDAEYVLFASICSEHTLRRIRPWFTQGLVRAKHFRVLTWYPGFADAIQAFALHVDEDAQDIAKNIENAWSGWKEVEKSIEVVEVYRYRATPTMQAIATPEEMKVELLPFNAVSLHECGTTDRRPALLLTHPSVSFEFFKDAFDDLWLTAMREAKEADVHPRWKTRRKMVLQSGQVTKET